VEGGISRQPAGATLGWAALVALPGWITIV